MLDPLFEYAKKEWRVIKGARFAFVAAVLVIGAVIWWIIDLRYSDRLNSANQAIKLMETKLAVSPTESAVEKIEKLQEELRSLRAETDASVSFSPPIIKEMKDGSYLVQSIMHINSTTPRTGLTIGITTDQFEGFSVVNITGAPLVHGRYTRPDAWTKLGAYRHHFRNVSGAYGLKIKIGKLAPILIGYILEGKEKEGIQRVTWQISEP